MEAGLKSKTIKQASGEIQQHLDAAGDEAAILLAEQFLDENRDDIQALFLAASTYKVAR